MGLTVADAARRPWPIFGFLFSGMVLALTASSCRPDVFNTTAPSATPGPGDVMVGIGDCSGSAVDQFAEFVQRAIRDADRAGLIDWIVDLRGNVGGNMWRIDGLSVDRGRDRIDALQMHARTRGQQVGVVRVEAIEVLSLGRYQMDRVQGPKEHRAIQPRAAAQPLSHG